jgi:hypothetical protein
MIDVGNLVDAGYRAMWRAALLSDELAADIFYGVMLQRRGGISALLRAVMD